MKRASYAMLRVYFPPGFCFASILDNQEGSMATMVHPCSVISLPLSLFISIGALIVYLFSV